MELSSAQEKKVPSPDAWKLLGRDTPAGKALFKLYNGDFKGKNTGQSFHEHNRQRQELKLAAGWSPKPIQEPAMPAVERPQINYPRFGHQKTAREPASRHIPRRKPASSIAEEMAADRQLLAQYRPVPQGPLLDDQEKARCATLMQYRGKLPEELVASALSAGVASRGCSKMNKAAGRSDLGEKAHLFDQIVLEIDERRQFLEDMQAAGRLTREVHEMLKCEIKQRVHELEKLDHMIQRDTHAGG